MSGQKSTYISLLLILIALVAVACQKQAQGNSTDASIKVLSPPTALTTLEDRGPLTDFSLTDHKGRKVTLADLKGQVWVADFFFTNCVAACPTMTARMAKLQQSLATTGLRLVSITVDPEHDTTAVLAQYAQRAGAKDDQWLFLTGEKAKIIELSVEGFRLSASEDPNTHSQRLVLVDREGHIRGYYRSDDDGEIEQLRRNAEALLKAEKS
ncbi:MAG: SCO family protein [Acidobacteriota bacterium]